MTTSPAPLAPTARREVHLRRITCTAFARDDGLWDIEGRLIDTKPQGLDLPERRVEADGAIHDMLVSLSVDRDFLIHDAWARTLHSPYQTCGEITASYRQLVGLRIEPGFTQKIKRLFRTTLGCSHLTELLPPMATTAYQVLWAEREGGASSAIGGCHALRPDGDVVRVHFPASFVPAEART